MNRVERDSLPKAARRGTPAGASNERNLVARKAAKQNLSEVLLEIDRINKGIAVAQSESARKRYQTRARIYHARMKQLTREEAR